ncbi:MAG: DUF5107 domain-containing protein [Ruminococcaceae bacterium]|nr:DUF5107 domain-containing protein [Oscillospiraceae bacterium]
MSAEIKRIKLNIPTYEPYPSEELPMFFEKRPYQGAEGRVYPIPYTDRLTNEPKDKEYDAVILKNEHIEAVLLPEIGGKIHKATDLHNGYEFIYGNTVIKPAMVGLAGPWVSGGVEFNFPQHHRPTTYMPSDCTVRENSDGSKTCIMSETDLFNRLRGQIAITVRPGSSVLEGEVTVYNRTDKPLPFMWWNNLAVRVHGKYKACFPPDIEWGNDHDRRAVISFPVMKGIYKTARPFDYGEGTDVTWYSNVKLPTSVMVSKGQSDMDFLGGYDFSANAGTVTVCDHRMSPGKKMWTWGDGVFGHTWCANLTDNGDRYIELMTGSYTDNQPDFTYIAPGETRKFTHLWFPIRDIGAPANASRNGALSFEITEGKINCAAMATSVRENAVLSLYRNGMLIESKKGTASPESIISLTADMIEGAKEYEFTLSLTDESGKELISYTPSKKGEKTPPKARPIPPRPSEIDSLEELYIHGKHLTQYKHHTYEADAYFAEALRRDPEDYRCNLEMGRFSMEKGEFDKAEAYLTKAVDRIKMRNDNPENTEALYTLGLVKKLKGETDKAYKLFSDASWQYAYRSPALYEMALIDMKNGEKEKALEELTECLITNGRHYGARTLKAYIEKDISGIEGVLKEVPTDTFASFALNFLNGTPIDGYTLERPENCLDASIDFENAGFIDEAVKCLTMCTNKNALTAFTLKRLTGEYEKATLVRCFPNRLTDIKTLDIDDGDAQYLLGCLYYDRRNYHDAERSWEKTLAKDPCHAFAMRNLAGSYFNHSNKKEEARALLEKALVYAPDNARILYELLQIYKNTGASPEERIALLEKNFELCKRRDDCFLELGILYTQVGELEKAKELLLSKRFNIYEGGEGKLTKHHGWLYTLLAEEEIKKGNIEKAKYYFDNAFIFPANYGEGRHYSAQEANINYFAGLLYESLGDIKTAKEKFNAAANQPTHITEITYFAALALIRLGEEEKAKEMLNAMLKAGEAKLENADLHGYFGVGMASPLPFELDIVKRNTIDALLLKALAYKGLGNREESEKAASALREIDPYGTPFAFFGMLEIL